MIDGLMQIEGSTSVHWYYQFLGLRSELDKYLTVILSAKLEFQPSMCLDMYILINAKKLQERSLQKATKDNYN